MTFFYLRQLWVYVFAVHECASNDASMYVWLESIAGRGSNEVVSCLHHYLQNLVGVVTPLCCFWTPVEDRTKMQLLCSTFTDGVVSEYTTYSFLPCDHEFAKTESFDAILMN